MLLIKRLTPTTIIPTKAHEDDAGFDLYSDEDTVIILPRTRKCIKTGISVKIPNECYGRIAARSGLSINNEIDVGAGVVDKNYRGEILICLINSSYKTTFTVNRGMKIAQLICEKIAYPIIKVVETLDETNRGYKGFGSSGWLKKKNIFLIEMSIRKIIITRYTIYEIYETSGSIGSAIYFINPVTSASSDIPTSLLPRLYLSI